MTVAQKIDLSAAALAYVRDFDWYVLPVGPDKKPLTTHGLLDASQDVQQIRLWWREHPDANIGIACGASGLVVMDLDVKHNLDGIAAWAALCEGHEPITTATASTASGGRHWYFEAPDLATIRNSAGKVAPGVDVRADGGYIILPPSSTDAGSYEWITRPEDGIANLPGWLRERLIKPERPPTPPGPEHEDRDLEPYIAAAVVGEVKKVREAANGTRNQTLNASAFALGGLIHCGLSEDLIFSELLAAAVSTGLSEREARPTITSGIEAGRKNPRTAPKDNIRNPEPETRTGMDGELVEAAAEPTLRRLPTTTLPADWLTADFPRRQFALGVACPKGAITFLCSVGGGGKSMLNLQASMGLACGRGLVAGWEPTEAGRVLLISLEDEVPEIWRRAQRIGHAFCVGDTEAALIAENLDVVHLAAPGFFRLGANKEIVAGPDLVALRKMLAGGDYALCVIDPVAALLAGNIEENSNPAAQRVVNLLTDITPPTTAMLIAAHVSKVDREGATSPRGAGAWSDAARQAWGLRALTAKEIGALPEGTDPDTVVALHSIKSNYTAVLPTVYLHRHTGGPGAGALQFMDVNASLADKKQREREAIDRTLLEVLATHSVTRSQVGGAVKKGEGYTRGEEVRTLVCEILGESVTVRQFRDAVDRLTAGKRLNQVLSEGGFKLLVPATIEVNHYA